MAKNLWDKLNYVRRMFVLQSLGKNKNREEEEEEDDDDNDVLDVRKAN